MLLRADRLTHIFCQCEDSLIPLVSPSCQSIASLYCSCGCIIDLKPVQSYQNSTSLSAHCASEFTVFLSRLCFREDLKEKHQPILSEFMSRKDEGQKHAPPSLSRCVEKMPTCGESTLAQVSQTIYFITVWSDTTSTAFPLSQGCTRSLCLILCSEVF